jgi:TPP-dependent pyruvate/acetoin dehydrogenase alpha subunit
MTIASTQIATQAAAEPPHNGFSLISNDKLLQIYSTMLKCRMLSECIHNYTADSNGISPDAAMSEIAPTAGVVLDLLAGDTLAPSPGGFIPSFVKGLSLEAIFARVASTHSLSAARTRAGYAPLKLIPPSLRLGVQLDRAVSAAAANKKSRNKKLAIVFCPNAADSLRLFEQAMSRAGARNLPMLFVCHSVLDTEDISSLAQNCGFPGVVVDGDDAVAIYRVATEAIVHARRGSGPTLIECKSWPFTGSEPRKRRASANPILNMESYLTRKGLFDKKFKLAVVANFRRELDAAIQSA